MKPKGAYTRRSFRMGDKIFTAYSIGWLALMLNKSALSIRRWEREGRFPRPVLSSSIQEDTRYYLAAEISAFSAALRQYPIIRRLGWNVDFERTCKEASAKIRAMLRQNSQSLPLALEHEAAFLQQLQLVGVRRRELRNKITRAEIEEGKV